MSRKPLSHASTLNRALSARAEAENWPCYRLFGVALASDYPFSGRLPVGPGPAELFFHCTSQKPLNECWEESPPVYTNPYRNANGESILMFYTAADYRVMHYPHIADFYLFEQGIACHLLDPAQQNLAALHLLPAAVCVWLELKRELFALHASAVIVGQCAIGFLAHSGQGKSTLAAAFGQVGCPLLTDDILLVEERHGVFHARPGYPALRLWPGEARLFLESYEDLEIIQAGSDKRRVAVGAQTFGAFWDQPAPLACLYLPQRQMGGENSQEIRIEPLAARKAAIELLRFAYTPRLSAALGREARRLSFITRLVSELPVRRLVYPSGHERLPAVRAALLEEGALKGCQTAKGKLAYKEEC